MKAQVLKSFGSVENLVMEDVPVPKPASNEVLVKVKAISINPVDIKTRLGKGRAASFKANEQIILGWDISGTVTETGDDVTAFKKGDEVFGMINFPGQGRAYAEYVAAPENHIALKPAGVTHEEAAAASLAALTAWQILTEKAKIKPGDKVLIHGAAGGVGHYAVQMCKYLGAEIAGTASAVNREFVLALGASRHIDYENEIFEHVIHDIDFVLDTIGESYVDRSMKVLRRGGTIVTIPSGGAEGIEDKAAELGLTGSRFMVQSDGKNMKEIASLLDKEIVKSYLSAIFPFDRIRDAHLQIETGKTRGKIAVSI
jgi:NADPH:quinone reductase-like Zn-dependent oxidoreductase